MQRRFPTLVILLAASLPVMAFAATPTQNTSAPAANAVPLAIVVPPPAKPTSVASPTYDPSQYHIITSPGINLTPANPVTTNGQTLQPTLRIDPNGCRPIGVASDLPPVPTLCMPNHQTNFRCTTGPASITLGGNRFRAYSCTDNASILLAPEPGTPASPRQMLFTRSQGGSSMVNQGDGNPVLGRAAYMAIDQLSLADIEAIIRETKTPDANLDRFLTSTVPLAPGSRLKEAVSVANTVVQCTLGPVSKKFPSSRWLVYGCRDNDRKLFFTPDAASFMLGETYAISDPTAKPPLVVISTAGWQMIEAPTNELRAMTAAERTALLAEIKKTVH